MMKKSNVILILAVLLIGAYDAKAQKADIETRLQKLEQEIQLLRQENKELKSGIDAPEVPQKIIKTPTESGIGQEPHQNQKLMTIERPKQLAPRYDDDVIMDDDDILDNPDADKPLQPQPLLKKKVEEQPQPEKKVEASEKTQPQEIDSHEDDEGVAIKEEHILKHPHQKKKPTAASKKTLPTKEQDEKDDDEDEDEEEEKDNSSSDAFKGKADSFLPTGIDQDDYERAMEFLSDGDYKKAETAFKAFLKNHPKSSLAINARYWLAETYFARKDFKNASINFAEAYQKHREVMKTKKSQNKEIQKEAFAKGPEALAKLALSLKGMGKKEEACIALEQLQGEFKQTPANVKKLAERARQGLKCPK